MLLLTCSPQLQTHQHCPESLLCFRENSQLLIASCVRSAQISSLLPFAGRRYKGEGHLGGLRILPVISTTLAFCPFRTHIGIYIRDGNFSVLTPNRNYKQTRKGDVGVPGVRSTPVWDIANRYLTSTKPGTECNLQGLPGNLAISKKYPMKSETSMSGRSPLR